MKKLVFDYKKFKGLVTSYAVDEAAAEIAQSIFDEWIKGATVVYGQAEGRGNPKQYDWAKNQISSDTHKALLVCIEPLKPKCEKHNPASDRTKKDIVTGNFYTVCLNCGEKIEPTGWKEKQ